ncbi:hypothetical protein [Gracilibacillus sp. YIM 98692]|uniref:hypothetical protein n=1 Tax=Gracilibacillus sp. YIM 98692 TaxID=2663532 RepID=UPI0013D4CDC7|nr:hypothetical protein [Gracilibacillus sp. YIM 98692]
MNKILFFLLVLALLIPNVVYANPTNSESISGSFLDETIVEQTLKSGELKVPQNKRIKLHPDKLYLDNNLIELEGYITRREGAVKKLNLSGQLYDSYTQKEGFDSYVGDLSDQSENFQVLYFMIKNDNVDYKYAFNQKLSDEKIFMLYLQDEDGNLYIFEEKLDQINIDASKINTTKKAQSNIDYLWFTNVLEPDEIGKSKNNNYHDSIGIASVNSDTKVSPIVYRDWTYGGDEFRESAWAKVYGLVNDVPQYGSSTAQTDLRLQEYVYKNGEFYSNDSNYKLQAAGSQAQRDIEGKIAFGYNTNVNYTYWDGEYWVWNEPNVAIKLKLATGLSLWSNGPSLGLELVQAEEKYSGSSNYTTYYPEGDDFPKNGVIYIEKEKDLYLDNHEEKLFLIADISTAKSSATTNVSTSAEIGWTFDIFYYDEFEPDDSQTNFGFSLDYISNAN